MNKNGFHFLICLILLCVTTCSLALPFKIVTRPGTTSPTSVVPGEPVPAYFLVTNETGTTRNGNYVKYLPPNVVQVTSGGTFTNTCGSSFNLAPKGQVGDTCTLQVSVLGGVDASDPNPQHQLFVCFPGGISCAGTNDLLNVVQLPPELVSINITVPATSVHITQSQQFAAQGNYSDGTSQNLTNAVTWVSASPANVSISPAGSATGNAIGTSSINANTNGITSNSIVLNVVSLAYITNSSLGNVSVCNVQASGTFTTPCAAQVTGFTTPNAISFNSSLSTAYTANSGTNTVGVCNINPTTGAFALPCMNSVDPSFSAPTGVAIDSTNDSVYVTNTTGHSVSICGLNPNGSLSPCFVSAITTLVTPTDIAINSETDNAYITDPGTASVNYCIIDASTNDFDSCTPVTAAGVITQPAGLALNPAGTFLYVADKTNGVAVCSLSGGAINTCLNAVAPGTIASPTAVAVNPQGTLVFVTNSAGTAYHCTINPNTGGLGGCLTAATGFANPGGIAVN